MQTKKSIYSKRCWIDSTLKPATISFGNGIITNIVYEKKEDAFDAGNSIIMPGVIDAHVHINEPGRTEWEGFETATKAAAAGGVTAIIDMPLNSSPVTTSAKAFDEKLAATKNKLYVNVGFYGGLVPDNLLELELLIKANVLGIKCFLTHSGIDDFANVGEKELEEAMPIIAKYNIPLLAHCEIFEKEIILEEEENVGSYQQYLASRPKQWENDAIALMIKLCRKYKCKTHIVHVSSAEALPLIEAAKKEGLPLTAETCAHYIYFNAENIPDNNTLYKCAPPIREKDNNELLKAALQSGVLDFITTDHSPAPPSLKEIASGNLQKAWGGIAGLQFLLPAAWTSLKDTMTMEEFIPLLTSGPAHFLNIHTTKGTLAVGYDADITIWNEQEEFLVQEKDIQYRHKISPYVDKKLFGVVQQTIVNGEIVFTKDKNFNPITYGKVILNKL
ncbi:MAG: allantoinase AllB [Ferruginibacter sp.]|nr:allantoinase AllB [Ferruginibacter sp.]